jgi:hypothetical protein
MAQILGNVKTTDLFQNKHKVLGIAINNASNSNGPFPVNFTTIKQAGSNLINLILTKKGERVSQPDFGCDIWKVVFEQIVDGDIDSKIENSILEAVNFWLPYISIDEIIVDYTPETIDTHGINVEINFSLASNPNIGDTVTVNVN